MNWRDTWPFNIPVQVTARAGRVWKIEFISYLNVQWKPWAAPDWGVK